MEFDKSRVFTALNADELKQGDKVIVADALATLKKWVESGSNAVTDYLLTVQDEEHPYRLQINDGTTHLLAYLVERAENCTNCERLGKTCNSREDDKISCCFDYKPKTEPKAEKHTDYNHCEEAKKAYACAMTNACLNKYYRPFKDTDELIKVWIEKIEADTVCDECEYSLSKLEMPYIWVRYKKNQCGQMGILITKYEKNYVQIEGDMIAMHALMADYEFLDSSPCGVEE